MAAPRNGKKGPGVATPKKRTAKAAPLATPADGVTEPADAAPMETAEDGPVYLTGELADDTPIETAEDAPLDLAEENPADEAVYAIIDADAAAEPAVEADAPVEPVDGTLNLQGVEERLPWLESDDDFDKSDGDGGRIAGFMIGGLLALALIVGGIWWIAHREKPEEIADGGVIEAPAVAYKQAPTNPGGKTFDGTGDSSFAMSEGKNPAARLGEDKLPPTPTETPATKPSASASSAAAPRPAAAPEAAGVGVQIAAFSSKSTAEAGWTRLSGRLEALKGVSHRIVEGKADIGTVYRLQAVPGDLAAANALCAKLKAAGAACQVKR